MKKNQNNSKGLEIDKLENIKLESSMDYELDEIEINKMLDIFEGGEIEVPERLTLELGKKLKDIKPKKSKYMLKGLVACGLFIVISYAAIPSFRGFASDILNLLFSDAGVQNAADNGYIEIEGITKKVDDFILEVDNIFIDELRLSFDVTMINPNVDLSGNNEEQYRLECKSNKELSISGYYSDGEKKNSKRASFTIMGNGINELFEKQQETLQLELVVLKENYVGSEEESYVGGHMLVGKGEFKTEVVGTTKVNINIPKEIYSRKKVYEINKSIREDDLEIMIESLTVSPTMMYLDTKIDFNKVENTHGIYNISILSDSGYSYKDNLTISGMGKEGNSEYRQTIVPSIYYDKGREITLKADGVIVQPEGVDVELKLDDKYPKKVEYFGSEMTIKNMVYKDGEINVYVKGNKHVSHAGFSKLDGEDYIASGTNSGESEEDRTYIFAFKGEKKNSYIFSLSMMMKYKVPIEVKIPIK